LRFYSKCGKIIKTLKHYVGGALIMKAKEVVMTAMVMMISGHKDRGSFQKYIIITQN